MGLARLGRGLGGAFGSGRMWSRLGVFVGTLFRIALLGLVLALAASMLRGRFGPEALWSGLSLGGLALAALSPPLAWLRARRGLRAAQEARRLAERARLLSEADRHRAALTRNLARAVRRNDYGAVTSDKRPEALEEFFASVKLDFGLIDRTEASALVSERLAGRKREPRKPRFDPESLPEDGLAFEAWVAEALSGFGWTAQTTPGSGDQGLDVIARRNGKTLGVQCKLYRSPIGNRAVQEAHAGKAFHGVDAAAVLSNAAFTPSARALAEATGVKLFSPHDIPELYEKTFGGRRRSA